MGRRTRACRDAEGDRGSPAPQLCSDIGNRISSRVGGDRFPSRRHSVRLAAHLLGYDVERRPPSVGICAVSGRRLSGRESAAAGGCGPQAVVAGSLLNTTDRRLGIVLHPADDGLKLDGHPGPTRLTLRSSRTALADGAACVPRRGSPCAVRPTFWNKVSMLLPCRRGARASPGPMPGLYAGSRSRVPGPEARPGGLQRTEARGRHAK